MYRYLGIIARLLVWACVAWTGMFVGAMGYVFGDSIVAMADGAAPWDALPQDELAATAEELMKLPAYWWQMVLACPRHPMGWVYLPFMALATPFFLRGGRWVEPLLFLHLMGSPWVTAVLDEGGSMPWGAYPIWVVWTVLVGVAWIVRYRAQSAVPPPEFPVPSEGGSAPHPDI
jgi:hypothetical protein